MVLWNEFQPQETSQRRSGLKFHQSLAMQISRGYCGRKSDMKKNIAYNRCDPGTIREEEKYGHFICKIEGRQLLFRVPVLANTFLLTRTIYLLTVCY